MATIYIIDPKAPWRRIGVLEYEHISGDKWRWAHFNNRKYLIGSTAFFTLEAARVARIGRCQQFMNSSSRRWWIQAHYPASYAACQRVAQEKT